MTNHAGKCYIIIIFIENFPLKKAQVLIPELLFDLIILGADIC
jgi:hypothetical protein